MAQGEDAKLIENGREVCAVTILDAYEPPPARRPAGTTEEPDASIEGMREPPLVVFVVAPGARRPHPGTNDVYELRPDGGETRRILITKSTFDGQVTAIVQPK